MEALTNRKDVVEMLKNLLAVEISARDRYQNEALEFKDPELKSSIESIKRDEDRHIQMIEELISKIEK